MDRSNISATTQVVMLTPEGRGAVASLLVEGPAATELVGGLFYPRNGRLLARQPYAKIVLGRWGASETGEEVVVCRRDGRRVEIHCHGGQAAAAAIIASLVDRGCQEIAWRQWGRLSSTDPLAAAARMALAAAPTERTAAILWDQYSGALRRAIDEISTQITRGNARAAIEKVEVLLNRAALGRHLVEPWKVVLTGRPNVGKSSLINALLGYERAIVDQSPGTTRDIVSGATALDGWPIELSDTAGVHESTDPLEASGIRLARGHLATADLVVLVFDAHSAWSSEDESLANDWPIAVQAFNKCDLIGQSTADPPIGPRLQVSAKTGERISDLKREIVRRLVPVAPAAAEAVPFAQEHVEALRQIRAALSAGQIATAGQLAADWRNWASTVC
jgi:tRNA modification GTPase